MSVPVKADAASRPFPVSLPLLLLAMLPCMLLAGQLEVPKWERPVAEARIYTYPLQLRPHSMRVDFPVSCRDFADAEALGRNGRLPQRLIRVDGRLVGVELNLRHNHLPGLGEHYGLAGAIRIYLYPQKQTRTDATVPAKPVSCWSGSAGVTARPGRGDEFLRFNRRRETLEFSGSLSNFPTAHIVTQHLRGKRKLRHQYAAMLRVSDATDLEFAVPNQYAGPWYLFLNGQPVFSWGRNTPGKEIFVSPAVPVEKGLNRLDLFTLLESGEQVAELRYRRSAANESFRRLPVQDLFSSRSALSLCVERRRDLLSPGLKIEPLQAYHCFGTETLIHLIRVQDVSRQWFAREIDERRLTVDRQPTLALDEGGARMFIAADSANRFDLQVNGGLGGRQRLQADFALDWTKAQQVTFRLKMIEVPLLVPPAGEPMAVSYELMVPSQFQYLLGEHGQLTTRYRTASGRILKKEVNEVPKSPYQRRVLLDWSALPNTRQVDVAVEIAGKPVAAPLHYYRIAAKDPLDFHNGGAFLRYRNGFTAIPRLVAASKGPAAAQSPVLPGRIELVDDFIAVGKHPFDDYDVETWPWEQIGADLTLHHRPVIPPAGALPAAAKYPVLAAAVKAKPSLLIWNVGFQDLCRGQNLRDLQTELLFVIHACRVRDIPLLLVAPPLTGHNEPERVREYALFVKEIAARFSLPVLDLYSASVREQDIGRFWQLKNASNGQTATPNAAGRRWFCQALHHALERAHTVPEGN